MTGPSLKKVDAHTLIHEAALNEARELRTLFAKCLQKEEEEKAFQVGEVIVEHWETRTLKHAESEEEGLYKEIIAEKPHLQEAVIQLTRDHDLMRNLVGQMKEMLEKKKLDDRFLSLVDGLILIDEIHNDDEMNKLFSSNE